jgi:diamine N-acetyltransferase
MDIELREVIPANWQEALRLAVYPDQQRFIAEYAPIVAIALAKAYLRLGGATWIPYAIYADATMVGFVELAYESNTPDQYWIFHFFIDQRYQSRGYGQASLQRFIELVKREHPTCEMLKLVVHPENHRAQFLYTAAGFRPTGAERWGEPVYQLDVRDTR